MNALSKIGSFLVAAASLAGAISADAYPYDDSLDDLPLFLSLVGAETRTNGTVATYNIPTDPYPSSITFTSIKGGNGGGAKASPDVGQDLEADGGMGALVRATFNIDPTASSALRPGGELRFVVGSKGERRFLGDAASGGGGGGTAVLYRGPQENSSWVILAVAGGGGGAAVRTIALSDYNRDGRDAETGTSGEDGYGYSGSGGANGRRGGGLAGDAPNAGGGGGYKVHSASGDYGRGGDTEGGAGGVTSSRSADGGFGFGGGGAGSSIEGIVTAAQDPNAYGGGGGGYSGGGAGDQGGGGGGGSFLHAAAINSSITIPSTSINENGQIQYNLTYGQNPSLSGPTVTLAGDDPLIYYDYDTPVEPGASAVDAYGNAVTVPNPTLPSGDGSEGTYEIAYTAVDQFGNSATVYRQVIVRSYDKPTFSILSTEVAVDEDSGAANFYEFAYDFDANDDGQALYQYSVTNTNNALFSNQPKVDKSGRLWFTPADDVNGEAEVTVIGIDNPDDPIHGSSDPVTFTLTINSVIDPPSTPTISNTLVLEEGGMTIGTVASTEPFGETLSFGLSGGDDRNRFDIDPLTGALTFTSIPDYESPTDVDQDNIYEVIVTASGSDGSSSATFEIEVLDLDEAPTNFTLSNAAVNEEIQTEVGVLSATEYYGGTVSFEIVGGADQSLFSIDPDTDVLSFISAPDYETPLDADGDNIYEVELAASGVDESVSATFAITVNDLSEKPVDFVISNQTVEENQTVVGIFSATDEFGGEVQFSLDGGWDQEFFDLDAETAELRFKNAPDFENPQDQDGNNVYRIRMTATSDRGSLQRVIFDIRVSNADEAPQAPTLSAAVVDENTSYVGLISAVGEPGHTLTYQFVDGGDTLRFSLDPDTGALSFLSEPNYENPGDVDGDNSYNISVFASDGELDSPVVSFEITVVNVNEAPYFFGSQTYDRPENEPSIAYLQAYDPEDDTLSYAISGGEDATLFTIDAASGQLSFISAPDYESPQDADADNTYEVEITASDAEFSTAASVLVSISDVDDINTSYFRSRYDMSVDGSDDAEDWSENGIANIHYLAFGLGDPREANVDRSRLPALEAASDFGDYAFSYLQPEGDDGLDLTLATTTDLSAGFVDLDTLGSEYQPVETETESLGDGYERITQHFDFVSGEGARFYRVEVTITNP